MKKILLLALIATFSFGKVVTIVDNGVERKISIPSSNIKARYISSEPTTIIVAFKGSVDIDRFEKKYRVKLKKSLSAGYYIFINNSKYSDIELISIISKESKTIIKTVRPNWGFGMIAR